jgi:peptide/nickel transport system substrate-binding protein
VTDRLVRRLAKIAVAIGVALALTLAISACGGTSAQKGGTLIVADKDATDYNDPQLSYTVDGWLALWVTYLPLLTYNHATGPAGNQVIPGLAKSLPKITNGGKTYTLTLRKGLKYSDGTPVKASDFKYAVERMFQVDSGGGSFYTDIKGATQFQKTKKGDISGIKTDDKTGKITINLVIPRGTFTNELGLMFVAPVPKGTPAKDQSAHPPPSTGPYMFESSSPGHGYTLVRNPQWKHNKATGIDVPDGYVNKIVYKTIKNQSSIVTEIEHGNVDFETHNPPADRLPEIKARHADQFRQEKAINTYFFWMNVTVPPFDNLKVRQAINYAVDPDAITRIYAGLFTPSQQVLPKGMPGYEKFELYPHNEAKAKQLVKQSGVDLGTPITVWTDDETPNDKVGPYYQDVLKGLGFTNVSLKVISGDTYFDVIGNANTKNLDTGFSNWFQDYPHPNDYFDTQLNGENIAKVHNQDTGLFNDPKINKKIDELAKQQLTSDDVKGKYAALDKEVMKQAPWAPYGNQDQATFVSKRIDLDKVQFNVLFQQDYTSFAINK